MNRKIELLAPAGSFDVMKACYAAGADAVYMGLNRFSARAFADNATPEAYQEAIRYAHRRGKKLYLTVNTLFKENELTADLYDLLAPLYETGLDAVIVQDTGVIAAIRKMFPELPVHASTQMTVTGPGAVRILKKTGVQRVIPARELSLKELKTIKQQTGVELECFIHGALCYSYSGQCLFSSVAGGRSGNRGRCAQPCRMNYTVIDEKGREAKSLYDGCVLSLKDLNTIDILPDIIEAGVDSLKIEGRLKKAEYAAGVTSIYRKYLDLYLEKGKPGFKVSKEDHQALFDLFNRQGFTDGYYVRHNGREMVTLKTQDFRAENTALTEMIREKYINNELKAPLRITYEAAEGAPVVLSAYFDVDGNEMSACVVSSVKAEHAVGRPMGAQEIEKQLKKLGGTGWYAESVTGTVSGSVFIPVSVLNELRRNLIEQAESASDAYYIRTSGNRNMSAAKTEPKRSGQASGLPALSVRVSDTVQLEAVLRETGISEVILESTAAEAGDYAGLVEKIGARGMKAVLAFPQIFRDRAYAYFKKHLDEIRNAGFYGCLIRSLDGLDFALENKLPGVLYGDHTLYGTNTVSAEWLAKQGIERRTLPLELKFQELSGLSEGNCALLVYGRVPMMVSAGCIQNTAFGCDGKRHRLILKDRLGNLMPVVNDCRYCMNTILNSRPVSLLSEKNAVTRLSPESLRLDFTVENAEETAETIRRFRSVFLENADIPETLQEYTRGHFRRGVD